MSGSGKVSGRSEEEAASRRKVIKAQVEKMRGLVREQEERLALNTRLPWSQAVVAQCPVLPRSPSNEEIFHEAVADPNATNMTTYIFKMDHGSRSQYFFPNAGLVEDPSKLKPNSIIALHPHSHCPLEVLPPEYDPRVRGMQVEERPDVRHCDLGGLDKQMDELNEVVLSLNHPELFSTIGVLPPKGILLFGPPGTGKTQLARMVAAQTKATFLRLSGTSLIQMYIGEGARMVRDAFRVALDRAPSIVFIDEIDSIGKKRHSADADRIGNREVSRTLMELLNQLDGFKPSTTVKVMAATNRVDVLDPALVRSGRFDRKVEVPEPNEAGREAIMKIHSRKMSLAKEINWAELAGESEGFNGAQCRAVTIEAGMAALRRNSPAITHADFAEALRILKERKKLTRSYYA